MANLFAMHHGPRSIPLCIQHHIQLTSLSFLVSGPSHSWVTAISTFYLQNPRSRSWVWSKFESQCESNILSTHIPFCSMSIGHPIPEIWLFQNLTLKIQGQGHGRDEHWKSQHGFNFPSTHIPLIPCQSAIPFLRYNFFKIWPWESKVKVMVEVKVESHKVGVASYWLTSLSFHVNLPSHSWDTAFSKFDLENPRSRSGVRGTLKVTRWMYHPNYSHPFRSMSIGPSIPEIQHFQNLTLKIQGQGQMTMMLHNYRSRQFHRSSNDINPSSGFRDTGSINFGPSVANGQAHKEQMGK